MGEQPPKRLNLPDMESQAVDPDVSACTPDGQVTLGPVVDPDVSACSPAGQVTLGPAVDPDVSACSPVASSVRGMLSGRPLFVPCRNRSVVGRHTLAKCINKASKFCKWLAQAYLLYYCIVTVLSKKECKSEHN